MSQNLVNLTEAISEISATIEPKRFTLDDAVNVSVTHKPFANFPEDACGTAMKYVVLGENFQPQRQCEERVIEKNKPHTVSFSLIPTDFQDGLINLYVYHNNSVMAIYEFEVVRQPDNSYLVTREDSFHVE